MSKGHVSDGLIVDWSPRKILTYDAGTQEVRTFTDPEAMPYGGRRALLAISRRSIFVRATRVPNAAPEDIRTIVQMKLAELFPVPPTDLAFDFTLLGDLNDEGRLALIVAMPVIELRRAMEHMAKAGIKVARVVPVALGSAFLAESLGHRDAAVVERTEDLASVDIVVGGVLRYSRVSPPGAPVEVEISRTFNASGLPCSAVIAAGGIQVGESDASTKLTALEALATASADRLKINLQLPEVIAAKELAERRMRTRIAFLMFVAAGIALYFSWQQRMDDQAAVDLQLKRLTTTLGNAQKYEKQAEKLQDEDQAIVASLTKAFKPAQRIHDIVSDSANQAPPGLWLTGASVVRGKELSIRGVATTGEAVDTYMSNLGADPRFRNVKLIFENYADIEKQPVVQFSISAFPNGNLPIALTAAQGGTTSAH